ncbi:MAG TPA: glucan biosynthesis protein D, partial [Nitrospiraceae bacterium]|nr:glucan biosynthesis protein D [Nitrospiraceae bacterium]
MLNRRQFLMLMAAVSALAGLPQARSRAGTSGIQFGTAKPFSFDELKQRAKAMATRPYEEPLVRHDEVLESIDYDAFQQIVFKRERG